mgnify:CR=1 FL=1
MSLCPCSLWSQPKPPADLTAEGPLAQALTELWEKTRKAKYSKIAKLIVKFYESGATWKVHQAMATLQAVQVTCRFEAGIEAEGVNSFQVQFDGRIDKANAVKSFLDPQIRSSSDHNFEAVYTLVFSSGLDLAGADPEALAKNLTRYGAGEAYVEAHAAPPEVK